MPKPKRGNKNNDKGKKAKSKHKMPASMIKRGNKREVVFDPEARKAHLRGFSERKRERRAFGLAMQKVKDRKAKIEQRASEKKDELERLEEAEKQKEQWMEEVVRMNNVALDSFNGGKDDDSDENNDGDSDEDNDMQRNEQQHEGDVLDTKVYDDKNMECTWGGQVIVTTSVVELDGDSDDDSNFSDSNGRTGKSVDTAQKYAGNVQKFMDELKGNMPGKKNRDKTNTKRKGKDGAADMKGVGGSGNLKIASKLLHKSKEKGFGGAGNGKKGKKRRR
jgi:ribosomal RNA-processing protein 17